MTRWLIPEEFQVTSSVIQLRPDMAGTQELPRAFEKVCREGVHPGTAVSLPGIWGRDSDKMY